MARPSKKRTATEAAILASLREGATRTAAAEAAGVHRNTLGNWTKQDSAFLGAVQQAEGEVEVEAAGVIRAAWRTGDWKAAAWWLERRRKDDYAQKQVTQLEGNDEKPIPMKIVGVR